MKMTTTPTWAIFTTFILSFLFSNMTYSQHSASCGFDHKHKTLLQNNPDYQREYRQYKNEFVARVSAQAQQRSVMNVLRVPVVVHVVHSGEAIGVGENISDAQIQAQIDILNLDFRAENDGFANTPSRWQNAIGNPMIQFCLANLDPSGQPSTGITRHNLDVTGTDSDNNNIEDEIKPAIFWDSDLYYNIYVLPIPGTDAGGGVTGYAYLPSNFAIGNDFDGSVVDYRWFGGPGFSQSGYTTLTHETGHYLGLPHTFDTDDNDDTNNCSEDDGIADTPNMAEATSSASPGLSCNNGFPTGPTTCTEEHMYVNFMDYARDNCSTSFSNGQIAVMRAVLEGSSVPSPFNWGSRADLLGNTGAVCSFLDNDVGIVAVSEPTTGACDTAMVTPIVTLKNFGVDNLTTVTITYQIDAQPPVDFIWIDNLGSLESAEISLAPFTPPTMDYNFTVYARLPNGVVDEDFSNDTSSVAVAITLPSSLPLNEDFESLDFAPTPSGIVVFNPGGDPYVWERRDGVSGFGMGAGCAFLDNFGANSSIRGTFDMLITPTYDFSNTEGASLNFDYAYTYYQDASDAFTDTLLIYVSTNCGSTFDQLLYKEGGANLATAPPTSNSFVPNQSQWASQTFDLSAYDGLPDVAFAFVNFSDWGNNLYLDNINVSAPCTITVNPISEDASCSATCDGVAATNATGGSGNYTYNWSHLQTPITDGILSNLCEGTYMVTVDDGAGCTATTSYTINAPDTLIATVTGTDETAVGANDGTASVLITGGVASYTYQWSPMQASSSTITGLSPNTYTVIVTDANQCTAVESYTVNSFGCNFGVTVSHETITCFGATTGTASATLTGGIPNYTYNWSSTTDNTPSVSGLGAGFVGLTVTDGAGCVDSASVMITQIDSMQIVLDAAVVSCFGETDGVVGVDILGGTAPYELLWSNDSTGLFIEDLPAGEYCITVTDANQCTNEACITVVQPEEVIVTVLPNDATCFELADGFATVTTNLGTNGFTFNWSNQVSGISTSGLPAGGHSVTVIDPNNCSSVHDFLILSPAPIELMMDVTHETVFGANDGTATVSAMGGTPGYFYTWPSNGNMALETGLSPGSHIVTVTDLNECTTTATAVINPAGINCDNFEDLATINNVLCNGDSTGSILVELLGGIPPYNFLWENESVESTRTGLTAGEYSVTISDSQGCPIETTYTVTEPSAIVLNLSSTPESAAGANDGTALAGVSGGTGAISYLWSNEETTPSIESLPPGTYTITVTDMNQCSATSQVVVNPGDIDCDNFNVSVGVIPVLCNGENTGSINLIGIGGIEPYSFDWADDPNAGNLRANLFAGTYVVTIMDSQGCERIETYVVEEPLALNVTMSSNGETVNGANDGTASASVTGGIQGYNYLWSTEEMTPTINNLAPGTYTVTVTDANQCTSVNEVNVPSGNMNCGDFEAESDILDVFCNGDSTGTIVVIPTGGILPYSITWGDSPSTGLERNNLEAGIYAATISDSQGCMLMQTYTVGQPSALSLMMSSTPISVVGANDGTASVSVLGGSVPYSYLWDNEETNPVITDLAPGVYVVTVIDANECISINEVEVGDANFNCEDLEGAAEITPRICEEDISMATVFVTNGVEPYQYLWPDNQMTQTAFDLFPGDHLVTVTDANQCEIVITVVMPEIPFLTVSISTTNESSFGANDGTATAMPQGGTPTYSFLWDNLQDGMTGTNFNAGNHVLTVTDSNGCTNITEFEIMRDTSDCSDFGVEIATTPTTCHNNANGTATAFPFSGEAPYSYLWDDQQVGQTAINLSPGFHSVTVNDAGECEFIQTLFIESPAELTLMVSTTPESSAGANDGTAMVTAMGGSGEYFYLWSTFEFTQSIGGLAAGTYTIVVTDSNDCVSETIAVVGSGNQDCSNFSVEFEFSESICFDSNDGFISIFANGVEPISYNWSNELNTSIGEGLEAGLYTITVVDGNQCSEIIEVQISEFDEITATFETEPVACAGDNTGTIAVFPSGGQGGYTFLWNNDDASTTQIIGGLSFGTYCVLVTDQNNCTNEFCSTVDGPPGFTYEEDVQNVSCNGGENGSIELFVTGANPFDFVWADGPTGPTRNGLIAGLYSVEITDANNCMFTENITIVQPNPIMGGVQVNNETVIGANDGTAEIFVTGGIPDYTYIWSTNDSTQMITGLGAGIYQVTVIDANGCQEIFEGQVEQGGVNCSLLEVSFETSSTTCVGNQDGTVIAFGSGGTEPYSYLWNTDDDTQLITGLAAGSYTVTVSDAEECSVMQTVEVGSAPELLLEVIGIDGSCGSPASVSASATGGTPLYTYQWDNGGIGSTLNNLNPGVYTVTVTDQNGCSAIGEAAVEVNSESLAVNASVIDLECFGDNNGSITLTVMNGTGPFVYDWSNDETTSTIVDLEPGTYSVLITDAQNCSFFSTYEVSSPAELGLTLDYTPADMGNNGSAIANAFGGTTPYSYDWNTGDDGVVASGLSAGNYIVTVTDANGCSIVDNVDVLITTAVNEIVGLSYFELFPNPTKDWAQLNAEFSESLEMEVSVIDVLGRTMYTQELNEMNLSLRLNTSSFVSGTYFVRIKTDQGQKVARLVVAK